jgi:hypothetical protein
MADLIEQFVEFINTEESLNDGCILEFGTGGGHSTARIAERTSRTIHTYDGFSGLPKTEKGVPIGTGWEEGALFFDEQQTREYLKPYDHVIVHKCLTFDLKHPSEYGITKISGLNVDVDLYEGSIDALRFADKCEWDTLMIRFDDWGYYEGIQIKEQVDAHEKAAFYDWLVETGYDAETSDELNAVSGNHQAIFKVIRNVR